MAFYAIQVVTFAAGLSAAIWLYLIFFRGFFWRGDQRLDAGAGPTPTPGQGWPEIAVIVPARNEAHLIGRCLAALLAQDYPGPFHVLVVDDESSDGTAETAHAMSGTGLSVIGTDPRPDGWTGKLWALASGVEHMAEATPEVRYVFFSDADIEHHPATLRSLIAKAEGDGLDLVSLMARLDCRAPWEKLLVPAFIFFFQKLYPFAWVNDPGRRMAAAAGGCVLLRKDALDGAGGLAAIKGALIDDCALARLIKHRGAVWLGLTGTSRSIRPYAGLGAIWDMVARSAYTQLNHSAALLVGTVFGMLVLYAAPPAAVLAGLMAGNGAMAGLGLAGWLVMAAAYGPTLSLYGRPRGAALLLPAAAVLYTAMTIQSAYRHGRGRGGHWKGRLNTP